MRVARKESPYLGDLAKPSPRAYLGDIPARPAHHLDQKTLAEKVAWHGQDLVNFMVPVQTTVTLVAPFNSARSYLILINDSANEIRIGFQHAANFVSGIPLVANGGFYEPILGTQSRITAISAVADSRLLIIEGYYSTDGVITKALRFAGRFLSSVRGAKKRV